MQISPVPFVADPDVFRSLQTRALPVACDHEQLLFEQGGSADGLYLLTHGRVRVNTCEADSGFEISFDVAAPSVLGLSGVLGKHPHEFSATACSHARLGFVHKDDLQAMLAADPAFSLRVLQLFAASVNALRHAIFDRMRDLSIGAETPDLRWSEAAS